MRFLFCFLFTKIPAFWRRDVEEPLINSATHLHAFALSSRRRQILDVAPLRLRFVSSIDTAHLRKSGRLHFISVSLNPTQGDQRLPIALRLQLAFLGRFRIRAVSQSPASFGLGSWTAQKRSTSAAHLRSSSLICGTFSHSSRFPIAYVLRTWLLDGSEFNIAVAFDLAAGL